MSCAGCAVGTDQKTPAGCRSHGHCMTGGCNKLNTYDWLHHIPLPSGQQYLVHEVSFKQGVRKGFYINKRNIDLMTGDMVCVETDNGYDVGRISLSGELVKWQLRKKRIPDGQDFPEILRHAGTHDLEKMMEGRAMEGATMLRARKIARELHLEMKIGEVEYQGDRKKATFYYIADERVDFRELIKIYAREFHVKIEMRQIGARQEAGKIGGLGSCGRELCCSTWLTDFKSVGTAAARYQNLSINQSKLSGQCGRLKCCLNYELDTYLDALEEFPREADILDTHSGRARLVKTDIFKKRMVYEFHEGGRQYPLTLEKVREITELNKRGEMPAGLEPAINEKPDTVKEEYANVIAEVTLKTIETAANKRRKKQQHAQNRNRGNAGNNNPQNRIGKRNNRRRPGDNRR